MRKLGEFELVHRNRALNPLVPPTRTPSGPETQPRAMALVDDSKAILHIRDESTTQACTDHQCRHISEVEVYFGTPAFSNNSPSHAFWFGFLVRRRPPSHLDTDAFGLIASNSAAA